MISVTLDYNVAGIDRVVRASDFASECLPSPPHKLLLPSAVQIDSQCTDLSLCVTSPEKYRPPPARIVPSMIEGDVDRFYDKMRMIHYA